MTPGRREFATVLIMFVCGFGIALIVDAAQLPDGETALCSVLLAVMFMAGAFGTVLQAPPRRPLPSACVVADPPELEQVWANLAGTYARLRKECPEALDAGREIAYELRSVLPDSIDDLVAGGVVLRVAHAMGERADAGVEAYEMVTEILAAALELTSLEWQPVGDL